jgi:epoxyqueuosine reductase
MTFQEAPSFLEGQTRAMEPCALTQAVKAEARRLGFEHCRIVPVAPAPQGEFFTSWVAAGRPGEMDYLARNVAKRLDPAALAEADQIAAAGPFRSLIVLGVNYYQFSLPPALRDDPSRGLIASYAWGDDYHEIIRPQLYALDAFLRRHTGRRALGKGLVDTGPVLERAWAQAAGLGFTGKNCCTIHPQEGSWLFLATLLVPEELVYDAVRPAAAAGPPPEAVLAGLPWAGDYGAWSIPLVDGRARTGTCGRCTRCLDACPTAAFVGPYHLDPHRCISYWTIETQAPIPHALRPLIGNRIFGCDICQEVCPWNLRLPPRTPLLAGLEAQAGRIALPLLEGFQPEAPYWLDAAAFAARFRRSPVKRAKRHGMLRTVCVALGNWGDPSAAPALTLALQDREPVVRGHAAWALGRILRRHRHPGVHATLAAALEREPDETVRAELRLALS